MALITTAEAAERLGVTDRRVRQMIEDGILKGEKVGRDYLIDEDSLEAAKERPKPGRPTKKATDKSTAKKRSKKSGKK